MDFLFLVISIAIASMILSPLLVRYVSRILEKCGAMDRPELYPSERGRSPAPYGIGVSIYLALLFFVPLILVFGDFSPVLEKRLLILLALGGLITLVSFLDDLETIGKSTLRIPPLVRLGMQILIGAIIGMTSIKISYVSSVFGGILDLTGYAYTLVLGELSLTFYLIPILVTICWYVLVFNAVNFSDGVPGLTGGFSLLTFVILGGLALKLLMTDTSSAARENSEFLLVLLAIIIPITFFVTRRDISRRGLMGDSGTIMLGFLIATLAIIAGGKIATAVSVLGIYLIDLVYVVTARILKGQNPLRGDQTHHLHYRLMELGFSHDTIRFTVYFLAGFFGLSAIFLDTGGKIALFVIIAFVTIFITQILSVIKK